MKNFVRYTIFFVCLLMMTVSEGQLPPPEVPAYLQPGGPYDPPTKPTITWPRTYSVFQRSNGRGGATTVTFAGQVINRTGAQYRIEKLDRFGNYHSDHTSFQSLPSGSMTQLGTSTSGYYFFTVFISAGWYRFTIKDGTSDTRQVKFGVGEVFFVAGQSNAQGEGATHFIPGVPELDCVVSGKIRSLECNVYDGDHAPGQPRSSNPEYVNLPSPVMGVLSPSNPQISGTGTRPWFYQSLGAQIAESELWDGGRVVPVAFFNAAMGGSSIANWKTSVDRVRAMFPGGNYATNLVPGTTTYQHNPWVGYNNFDTRFPYIALRNDLSSLANMFGVRAVLWHQGEAETHSINTLGSGYNVTNYRVQLKALIDETRSYLSNLPWAICKVSYVNGAGNSSVTNEQQEVYNTTSTISWASQNSDSYTSSYREVDDTHFNVNGLTAISNEIYSNWSSIKSKTPIQPMIQARISMTKLSPGLEKATTGAYARYFWQTNINAYQFPQNNASTINNETIAVGVSGYVKNAYGNIHLIVPSVSVWGVSGARIGFEPLVENVVEIESEKSHAFPNPTSTAEVLTIYFGLKDPSDISLKLYDVQGRLVEQVSKDNAPAGIHEFKFPVSSLKGSGETLLYHLITNEHNETKKVLLIK